jgi:hypothetical protein
VPIRVIRRKDTGSLSLDGHVNVQRIRRCAQSDDPKLANEEAAALEAELLRTAWHGERRGARSLAAGPPVASAGEPPPRMAVRQYLELSGGRVRVFLSSGEFVFAFFLLSSAVKFAVRLGLSAQRVDVPAIAEDPGGDPGRGAGRRTGQDRRRQHRPRVPF